MEKDLDEIVNEGGDVQFNIDQEHGFVNVLWVQTKEMKSQISRVKPSVFQSDTTFNKNKEGYKLLIPVFQDTVIGKSGHAGLLFLATETHDNIKIGLNYVKNAINYVPSERLIFLLTMILTIWSFGKLIIRL